MRGRKRQTPAADLLVYLKNQRNRNQRLYDKRLKAGYDDNALIDTKMQIEKWQIWYDLVKDNFNTKRK